MTHSDDQGLILPPRLAPTQVVIVPIFFNDEQKTDVLDKADQIEQELDDAGISVKLDARESQRPGWKFNEYEVQGVPLRIGIGPRDLENDNVELARRDEQSKEIVPQAGLTERIESTLDDIQQSLFQNAKERRAERTTRVDSYDDFEEALEETGGFVEAHWDGTPETEARIKDETKATIRLVPLEDGEPGEDPVSGEPSERRVVFARSY